MEFPPYRLSAKSQTGFNLFVARDKASSSQGVLVCVIKISSESKYMGSYGESEKFSSLLTWALMGVFSHKPLCCRTWKIFVILGTAKVPTLGGESIVSAR